MKRQILLMLGALLLLGAGAATACSSDTADLEDQVDTLESQQTTMNDQLTALTGSSQVSGVIAALNTLGGAELHAIDEAANEQNTVDAGAAGGVEAAILAMSATSWPEDLQAGADDLTAALEELLAALETEDPAVVGPAAATAHEVSHDFEHEAAEYLAAASGTETEHEEGGETPAAGETAEEHDEESETPEAGQTPEAGG